MKYPWMPLFNGDLLADTMHLSAQEFGAYMLLIIHAWKHDAKVHYSDARAIARIRPDHWPRVFLKLQPFFEWEQSSQGTLTTGTHTRVHRELLNAGELSNKRKAAAMQMHAKRRASASHPPSQSLKSLSLSQEGKAKNAVQMHVDYRDKGPDYRAPPSPYKSDNVLQPIPEKTQKP